MLSASKPVKQKRCKIKDADGVVCGAMFTPHRTFQMWCSPVCALNKLANDKAAKVAKEARKRAKELREAKIKAKSRRKWEKEAQAVFNRFRRLSDELAGYGCISCGTMHVESTVGGGWDCGHFLGVGAYPELRFEPLNAHRQCKKCNGGSGKWAKKKRGVDDAYRIELIKRIGIEKVEWLEGPHEPVKHSIEDLREIKARYSKMARELMKRLWR